MYRQTGYFLLEKKGGDHVLQDTMSKIRDAESQADQIIKDAEAECKKILEDARQKASDMKQQVSGKGKEQALAAQKDADARTEKETQVFLADAETELSDLKQNASKKEKEAINLVVSLLV